MEKELNYKEWYFQSDYDLETAYQMLQSGRNVCSLKNIQVMFMNKQE